MKHSLFVYGTLEVTEVISSLIGRRISFSTAFALDHYRCLLQDRIYPGLIPYKGRVTSGRLYVDLTDQEIFTLDAFEGATYNREHLNIYRLGIGVSVAFSYILDKAYHQLMSSTPWNREVFVRHHLDDYLLNVSS